MPEYSSMYGHASLFIKVMSDLYILGSSFFKFWISDAFCAAQWKDSYSNKYLYPRTILSIDQESIKSNGYKSDDYNENISWYSQFSQEELNDLIPGLSLSYKNK